MSDCCPESELVDDTAQLLVDDDCTVIVEVEAGGPPGPQGSAATIAVGTTTTLAPGSSATVANSGTSSAAIFDFGIPEGQQGIQGVPGPQGIQGVPGTAATVNVGSTTTLAAGSPATVANSGTTSAAIFDFGIPEGQQGIQGIQGIQGDAATINAGTTTTLSPGSPATVVNSGTTSAAVFDFGIPEGQQGVQGVPGDAATVTVGTTTTVDPTDPALVTNSGTSSAAILDFEIPRGETGFVAQDNPPVFTDVLWLDTDEPADMVVPPGGTTGQALVKVSGSDYDTDWATIAIDNEAPGFQWWSGYASGYRFSVQSYSNSIASRAMSANQIYFVPIWIPTTISIDLIEAYWFAISTGLGRLGLYDGTGTDGLPGSLIFDSGDIALDVAGNKSIVVSETLLANRWYWLASTQNINGNMQGFSRVGVAPVVRQDTPASGSQFSVVAQSRSYSALPATASAGTGTFTVLPNIVVRVA